MPYFIATFTIATIYSHLILFCGILLYIFKPKEMLPMKAAHMYLCTSAYLASKSYFTR